MALKASSSSMKKASSSSMKKAVQQSRVMKAMTVMKMKRVSTTVRRAAAKHGLKLPKTAMVDNRAGNKVSKKNKAELETRSSRGKQAQAKYRARVFKEAEKAVEATYAVEAFKEAEKDHHVAMMNALVKHEAAKAAVGAANLKDVTFCKLATAFAKVKGEEEEIQITKEEMLPLLDMTSLKGAPWLQAVAATSLSKMAEEKNVILHDARVFQSIHELVQVDSTDVAHPTSCLVWHLAGQEEAQPFFASAMIPNLGTQILLMTILWNILLDVTHPQVKAKLAQALNLCLKKQKERLVSKQECYLGAEDAQTLFDEMGTGLRTKDMSLEVRKEMEEAYLLLETIRSPV